jgi:hypothetical protein
MVRKNHSRLGSPAVAQRKEKEEYEDFSNEGRKAACVEQKSSAEQRDEGDHDEASE